MWTPERRGGTGRRWGKATLRSVRIQAETCLRCCFSMTLRRSLTTSKTARFSGVSSTNCPPRPLPISSDMDDRAPPLPTKRRADSYAKSCLCSSVSFPSFAVIKSAFLSFSAALLDSPSSSSSSEKLPPHSSSSSSIPPSSAWLGVLGSSSSNLSVAVISSLVASSFPPETRNLTSRTSLLLLVSLLPSPLSSSFASPSSSPSLSSLGCSSSSPSSSPSSSLTRAFLQGRGVLEEKAGGMGAPVIGSIVLWRASYLSSSSSSSSLTFPSILSSSFFGILVIKDAATL
mmetsp:Transcript_37917/g.61614  ORF Transcript_37917/g.61614 Transcript_37917/m.61614 type:complete len:287 (-) Transcript_37917:493-1353(-)